VFHSHTRCWLRPRAPAASGPHVGLQNVSVSRMRRQITGSSSSRPTPSKQRCVKGECAFIEPTGRDRPPPPAARIWSALGCGAFCPLSPSLSLPPSILILCQSSVLGPCAAFGKAGQSHEADQGVARHRRPVRLFAAERPRKLQQHPPATRALSPHLVHLLHGAANPPRPRSSCAPLTAEGTRAGVAVARRRASAARLTKNGTPCALTCAEPS